MSPRLKQLAIESKLIAPEYNGFDHTRLSISQQKFAELIVQECVNICAEEAQDNSDDDRAMRSIEACGWMIKQHFGIKS